MKSVKFVRAEVLAGYVNLANSLNLDARRLLRSVRLDNVDFSDQKLEIPVRSVFDLLEISTRAAEIEDFGLRLAANRGLGQIGPVALLLLEQPTTGHALQAAKVYLTHSNEAVAFDVFEHEQSVEVRISYKATSKGQTRQGMEYAIGTIFRTFDALTSGAWAPQQVVFMHPPPKAATIHKKLFRTKVAFGREFNGYILKRDVLDIPIRSSSPDMASYAKKHLEAIAVKTNLSFQARVREVILHLLPSGRCTIEIVADHLGIDRTTITRRLGSDGESFSSLVDDVRIELVRRYIMTDQRPLTEISRLLGFSSLATFSRWFSQEFGMSASRWRSSEKSR